MIVNAVDEQNIPFNIPFCGYGASSALLTSSEQFPNFVRANPGNGNMAMAVAAVARTLQWKQVAILTSDDAYAGDLGRKIFAALGSDTSRVFHGLFRGGAGGGNMDTILVRPGGGAFSRTRARNA